MNKLTPMLLLLATAGIALAAIDPSRPMVTGRGNVDARPGKTLIANQTSTDNPVHLDRFLVTGSLLKPTPKASAPRKH